MCRLYLALSGCCFRAFCGGTRLLSIERALDSVARERKQGTALPSSTRTVLGYAAEGARDYRRHRCERIVFSDGVRARVPLLESSSVRGRAV